jgi:hypothetical protein
LTSATLAFIAGIKPSHNYWDYLIDPLLGLYCCLTLLVLGTRWTYRRFITLRGPIRNRSV